MHTSDQSDRSYAVIRRNISNIYCQQVVGYVSL